MYMTVRGLWATRLSLNVIIFCSCSMIRTGIFLVFSQGRISANIRRVVGYGCQRNSRTVMGDKKHSNTSKDVSTKRQRIDAHPTDSHDKKSKLDTSSEKGYYLMKSEADVFSIDDLAARDQQTEPWDGVRNHQAKKIMQGMQVGDLAFFWASNTKKPGIVGVVEVVKTAYPDETQFDPKSPYYYAKATRDAPVWYNVDVQLKEKFETPIYLSDLKQYATKELADMPLFTMKRLSVQHVPEPMWHFILEQKQ